MLHYYWKIDFVFLAKQHREQDNWNQSLFNANVIIYSEDKYKLKKQFSIAKPIYSADGKFAFVYYFESCGSPDCGSTTVKVYRKRNCGWIFYVQFPISIS